MYIIDIYVCVSRENPPKKGSSSSTGSNPLKSLRIWGEPFLIGSSGGSLGTGSCIDHLPGC